MGYPWAWAGLELQSELTKCCYSHLCWCCTAALLQSASKNTVSDMLRPRRRKVHGFLIVQCHFLGPMAHIYHLSRLSACSTNIEWILSRLSAWLLLILNGYCISVSFSSSKIEGGSDQHFILKSSTNTCHCYRWMWAVNSASGHQSVLPGGPQRVLQMKERFIVIVVLAVIKVRWHWNNIAIKISSYCLESWSSSITGGKFLAELAHFVLVQPLMQYVWDTR